MGRPTLIVVSGPPGSGKTTLAHEIARAIPCIAISRDEIKEGIVHAEGGQMPEWGGPVSQRTVGTFYAVLRLLLGAEVTVVAEAAFQDRLWAPDLDELARIATIRVVHCGVDSAIARARIARRAMQPGRVGHPDALVLEALDSGKLPLDAFEPIALAYPSIRVDTTNGYDPVLEEIVAFVKG